MNYGKIASKCESPKGGSESESENVCGTFGKLLNDQFGATDSDGGIRFRDVGK